MDCSTLSGKSRNSWEPTVNPAAGIPPPAIVTLAPTNPRSKLNEFLGCLKDFHERFLRDSAASRNSGSELAVYGSLTRIPKTTRCPEMSSVLYE